MSNYPDANSIDDRFARIEPIVGDALKQRRVTIVGRRATARLVEYLACTGVARFDLIATENIAGREDCAIKMLERTCARLGLDIESNIYQEVSSYHSSADKQTNLFIGTGGRAEYEFTKAAVIEHNVPALFYRVMPNGSGLMLYLPPGSKTWTPDWLYFGHGYRDPFAELHLTNVVANFARGLLLKGSAYARTDIEEVLGNEAQLFMVGHPSWPWSIKKVNLWGSHYDFLNENSNEPLDLQGRNCLIIGLGSLGSVVAETMADLGANLILVDGEEVASVNPIRQIYGLDQVGKAKARAAADTLSQRRCGSWHQPRSNHWIWRSREQFLVSCKAEIRPDRGTVALLAQLIAEYQPEVAVVATGTAHDRAISQLLRNSGVAHVVVSCYARARFFEAIAVDAQGGPCFGCVRGHLHLGTQPSLTPEQRAHYVSNDQELTAEPATRIETGRAADLGAQIACALLLPEQMPWLARARAEESNFFLGGNCVDRQDDGALAYGIEWPGEVRLYGLQDIAGRGSYLECWDCGRQLPVAIQYLDKIEQAG